MTDDDLNELERWYRDFDVCIPARVRGDALRLIAELRAALETARVVAVLDGFNPNWQMALAPDGGHYCLPRNDALAFDGPTPALARKAAADWIEGPT